MRIINVALTIIIVIVLTITVVAQNNQSSRVLVRHIVLEGEYTPRFIWNTANSAIQVGSYVSDKDIACVREELMKTGIFANIHSSLYPLKNSGGYDLTLRFDYISPEPVFPLGIVDVKDIEGVDDSVFQRLLISEHLAGSLISIRNEDYADFQEKLFELLRQSIPDESKRDWSIPPLEVLRVDSKGRLNIALRSKWSMCRE